MSERRFSEDYADFLEPGIRRLVKIRLRGQRLPQRRLLEDDAVEELKAVVQNSEEFREVLDEWTKVTR